MKRISLFFTILFLLGSLCLAKRNTRISDKEQDNLFGKVKAVQTMEYSVVSKNKEVQKGEMFARTVKTYNKAGYTTENTEFDTDNTILQKEVFIFDNKGNKIEELLYDDDGELEQRITIKYNSLNLPVKFIYEDDNGKIIQKFVHQYDERDYLVQLTGYDDKGRMSEKSYYTYNQQGNITQYTGFGQFENQKIYYKYDLSGKLTEQIFTDTKDNFIEKITFQYENQYKTEKRICLNENNQTLYSKTYIYDDYNNLLEFIHVDKDGQIVEKQQFAYKYGKNNNWIQQISYTGVEKSPVSIIERVIEYYE